MLHFRTSFSIGAFEDAVSIMLRALIVRAYKVLSFESYYDFPKRSMTLRQKDVAIVLVVSQ